jgi:hypothetical protein
MAAAYRGMVEFYRKQYQLSAQEALAKVSDPSPAYDENLRQMPADQVSWVDLQYLTEKDPDLAAQAWENIKQAALDELRSGHRAGHAIEGSYTTPWSRARFQAIRTDLAAEWQPRSGIERQLIDTMAQAQTLALCWMETFTTWTTIAAERQQRKVDQDGSWQPPRISEDEAIERAFVMFERFNRVFLRTLHALQDLRRNTPTVLVQNAGQVNVGGQQLTLVKSPADSDG